MTESARAPDPRLRRRLVEAITELAADADDQIAWMAAMKVDADELALQLADIWPAARPLVDPEVAAVIDAIHGLFGSMSGPTNSVLWDDNAVRSGEGWARARTLARAALVGLST